MFDVHGIVSLCLVYNNAYRLHNDTKSKSPKSSLLMLKRQIQHAPFQVKRANPYSMK